MPHLYVPVDGQLIDSRAPEVARRLQARDPGLELTLERVRMRRGDGAIIKGHRWVVRWHAPDGKTHFVGRWKTGELLKIEADVMRQDQAMNPRAAEEMVDDIERHNDAKDRAIDRRSDAIVEEMADHAAFALNRDSDSPFFRSAPKSRFPSVGIPSPKKARKLRKRRETSGADT